MSFISWWKLESDGTDTWHNYDGIVHGSPSWTNGILGNCFDNTANNSNTGVELIQHADAKKYDGKHSWSFWIYSTTTSGSSGIRIMSRDCSEYACFLIDQSTSPNTLYGDLVSTDVNANQWYHVVVVALDNSTYETYVDGVYQGTSGASYNSSAARPWVIGGNTEGDGDISGSEFVGKIDDVRFYDHRLSEKEIKELSKAKVGHWKLDYAGQSQDCSGYENDALISGATFTKNTSIGRGAFSFDGTDDYMNPQLTTGDVLGSGQQLTYSAWMRGTTTDEWDVIVGTRAGNDFQVGNESGNGNAAILYTTVSSGNINAPVSNTQIYDGKWHHVVGTWDNGLVELYVDGGEVASNSSDGDTLSTSSDIVGIGAEPSNNRRYHEGEISDVRIYSRALSSSEVQELYQQRASLDSGGVFYSV